MSGYYDAIAKNSLATIQRMGAPVAFQRGGSSGGSAASPATYDPLSDTWSGGANGAPSSSTQVTGKAIATKTDPDRFAALGLVLVNPQTLIVAARGLGIKPTAGDTMVWAGTSYTVKLAEPVAPDGEPIVWLVTGSQ